MKDILQQGRENYKFWGQITVFSTIAGLAALAAFGAGILVGQERVKSGPTVLERDIAKETPTMVDTGATSTAEALGIPTGETVVASKTGSKYHFPWCSGAKRIAEKSKITFPSAKEAREAGYTPAANCKGLK